MFISFKVNTMTDNPNLNVEAVSDFPAARNEPLSYPGNRPDYSFATDGRSLSESTASLVEQEPDPSKPRRTLDDILKA